MNQQTYIHYCESNQFSGLFRVVVNGETWLDGLQLRAAVRLVHAMRSHEVQA